MEKVKRVTYAQNIGQYQVIGVQMESGKHSTTAFDDLGNPIKHSSGLLQTVLWAERQPLIIPPRKVIPVYSSLIEKALNLLKV